MKVGLAYVPYMLTTHCMLEINNIVRMLGRTEERFNLEYTAYD